MALSLVLLIIPLTFPNESGGSVEEPRMRSNLVAITTFNGLEDYYTQVRERRPPARVIFESVTPTSTTPRRTEGFTFESITPRSNTPRHSGRFTFESITPRQSEGFTFESITPRPNTPRRSQELRSEEKRDAISFNPFGKEDWSASVKRKICMSIFRSDFFDARGKDGMDLETVDAYQDLKRRKHTLFKEIYPKRIFRRRLKSLFCGGRSLPKSHEQFDHLYVNQVRSKSVSIKGVALTEKFFICPVKDRNLNGKIKRYFVSKEYNVNAAYLNPDAPFIVGRFIFRQNEQKQLVIDALAEEPAEVLRQGEEAEKRYAEIKKKTSSTLVDQRVSDPIRELTANDKHRLCATIFSSAAFTGRVKYVPTPDDIVEPNREEQTVSFMNADTEEAAHQETYTELTVVCEPSQRTVQMMAPASYVSRADRSNRIFLYTSSPGRYKVLYPEYYFTNVSVIAA